MRQTEQAMDAMENEGGSSSPRTASRARDSETSFQLHRHPSSVIAVFADQSAADGALRQLRALGIMNEDIAVMQSDSVIHTPANDAGTYRATGEQSDGFEFRDDPLPDSFHQSPKVAVQASPNSPGYDEDYEARQYHSPLHQVVVSVHVEDAQYQPVHDALAAAGRTV
jgi:hypothetical protein